MMETKVITAHVPTNLAKEVDKMSQRLERSKNWIVKQALTAWLDQEDQRYRLTQEALMDVDNDNVISHQSILDWANSLDSKHPLDLPKK